MQIFALYVVDLYLRRLMHAGKYSSQVAAQSLYVQNAYEIGRN